MSFSVSLSDWGLQTFTIADKTVQVNVTGWKTVWATGDNKIQLQRNDNRVRLSMHGYTANLTTSFVQYGNAAVLSSWKPRMDVTFLGYDATFIIRIKNDGVLYWKSNTGASIANKTLYGQFEWSLA